MPISELINKYVDEPLPWCWLVEAFSHQLYLILFNEFFGNLALLVFAPSDGQTRTVRILPVQNSFNNEGACVVNKGLARRFYDAIEESAELVFEKISYIPFVIDDIVFNDFSEHNTESTFVFETSC